VVEPRPVDARDRRLSVGVGGHKHTHGRRKDLDRLREQLHDCRARHLLVDEEHRNVRTGLVE